MSASTAIEMSAFAHRRWYAPGDTVRIQVAVEARPLNPLSRRGNASLSPATPPPSFNFYCVDETSIDLGDAEVLIRQLTASLTGLCDVDTHLITWGADAIPVEEYAAADGRRGVLTRRRHILFAPPQWEVAEDVLLCSKQCSAFSLSFRLPACLPPTMEGASASFTYAVQLRATWRPVRTNASSQQYHVKSLHVPLLVYSSSASLMPTIVSSIFPLEHDDPLLLDNYEFKAVPLPAAPSSATSAPLQDALVPGDVQVRTPWHAWREMTLAAHNGLATLPSRNDQLRKIRIPLGSRGVAVEVTLLSSSVPLGTALVGALECGQADDGDADKFSHDPSAPVPVAATLYVEMMECCHRSRVHPSVSGKQQSVAGMEEMVTLRTSVVAKEVFVLLNSPKSPFSISISAPGAYPTMLTEVLCILWRLRVDIVWSTREDASKLQHGNCSELCVGDENLQALIPFAVVPPHASDNNRRGSVYC